MAGERPVDEDCVAKGDVWLHPLRFVTKTSDSNPAVPQLRAQASTRAALSRKVTVPALSKW
ncbi:MAG TPA: hypothetical protein VE400_07685 [Mycobacterium sp.]|nr:hypothetical protein [Mycobacterium sp.]